MSYLMCIIKILRNLTCEIHNYQSLNFKALFSLLFLSPWLNQIFNIWGRHSFVC